MSDFRAILEPIAELLEKKNHDYGDSYTALRDKYGPVAFYVRIADKLNRVEQLDKAEQQVNNESVIDTLRDIIGYAALELRYRMSGKTPLNMSHETKNCGNCFNSFSSSYPGSMKILLECGLGPNKKAECFKEGRKYWVSKEDK